MEGQITTVEKDARGAIQEAMDAAKNATQGQGTMLESQTSGIQRKYTANGTALTNAMGGIILNKQDFVFDHLNEGTDIKDDYKIQDVLGAGAYGEVRKCKHRRTKNERAVKIISKESMNNKEQKRLK